MKKCVYIIFAWDYNNSIGGNLVLHSLSENLSLLGEEVYITCKNKREYSLAKSINKKSDIWSSLSKENTIVGYPEIIVNNPLKAKHICRWLLNNPGAFKKFDGFWMKFELHLFLMNFGTILMKFKIKIFGKFW